jgi:hypothetical protein
MDSGSSYKQYLNDGYMRRAPFQEAHGRRVSVAALI